jgi:hypothetical protein
VRGPFRDPAPPSFDILSVLVSTSRDTCFILEGSTCKEGMTAAEFFAQAIGQQVEAWGTWNTPVLGAVKVEIKVGDDE